VEWIAGYSGCKDNAAKCSTHCCVHSPVGVDRADVGQVNVPHRCS
jgi:hypothetical protein